MDHVVNWLMLIFVFLADPGAVLLVILTNKIIKVYREDKKFKKSKGEIEEGVSVKLETAEEEKQVVNFDDTNELLDKISKMVEEEKEENEDVEQDVEVEKKKIVEYVADQSGDFVKIEKQIIDVGEDLIMPGIFTAQTSTTEVKTIKNEDRSEYTTLLTHFYAGGKAKKGSEIPTFPEFKKMLEDVNIIVNEKTLQDFLLICGLLKITEFNNKKGVYNKEFEEAKLLMSEI